jgi:hypothetical protein
LEIDLRAPVLPESLYLFRQIFDREQRIKPLGKSLMETFRNIASVHLFGKQNIDEDRIIPKIRAQVSQKCLNRDVVSATDNGPGNVLYGHIPRQISILNLERLEVEGRLSVQLLGRMT